MDQNEFLDFLANAVDTSRKDCFEFFEEQEIVYLLKTSDEKTRQCFYPATEIKSDWQFLPDTRTAFAELAIKYACYGLKMTSAHGFCDTVQNCSYDIIGNWFKSHSELGSDFLAVYLKKYDKEPADPEFQQELFKTITGTAFITGEWCRNLTDSPARAKLLLAAVRRYMPQQYDELLRVWGNYFPPDTMAQLKQVEWFGKYEGVDTLYENHFKESIKNAVETISNVKDHQNVGREFWSGVGMNGDIEYITHHEYDCGVAVVDWLNNGEAASYGLRSSKNPSNHVDEQSSHWEHYPPSPGCVAPDARILMADGCEKEICRIQPGERVLSEGGIISECSDELIYNDTISVMYGINEFPPFLSLEHAVMTQRGWCSMNPALSNEINPHFHVKMLEPGDKVTMLSRNQEGIPTPTQVTVENISIKKAEKGTYLEGYDLHFREGKNSYYANGILCLLNYPEITIKRIVGNLQTMSEEDRAGFIRLAEENRHLFEQVFGKTAIQQFAVQIKR